MTWLCGSLFFVHSRSVAIFFFGVSYILDTCILLFIFLIFFLLISSVNFLRSMFAIHSNVWEPKRVNQSLSLSLSSNITFSFYFFFFLLFLFQFNSIQLICYAFVRYSDLLNNFVFSFPLHSFRVMERERGEKRPSQSQIIYIYKRIEFVSVSHEFHVRMHIEFNSLHRYGFV